MESKKCDFENRICAAITSGWWLILGSAVLITFYYVFYLWLATAQPQWVLVLLGPNVSWTTFQQIGLGVLVVMKLILWVFIGIVAWLMLWLRQLKKF